MKTLKFTLFISILAVFSCQKEAVTKPVSFKGTEYESLAPFDESGRPTNVENETVSSELQSFGSDNLPEAQDLRKTNPELLSSNTNTDMQITQKSEVYVTFVKQATVFKNTLAFYTYPTGTPPTSPKDIKKITYFFPNVGQQTPLARGDKVKIGSFEAGTSIGFVLLKDAWNPVTKQINSEAVHFCYNDALNPEVDPKLKKHVVLLNYAAENKIMIGFEDIDRTSKDCDHDFNDVLVYATIKK